MGLGPAWRGGGRTTWRRGRARSADCVAPGRTAGRGLRRLRSGARLPARTTPNAQGRAGGGAALSPHRCTRRLQEDPPAGVSGAPSENNIMVWNAVIFG